MYKGFSHKNIMVVGAGYSVKQYGDQLRSYIYDHGYTTIGINNMTSFCHPDYHLWTNRQRYGKYGDTVNMKRSVLMLGPSITNIKKEHKKSFVSVEVNDNKKYGENFALREKMIKGWFRTAGCLAIAIASLMDAESILVAGMDGFTYRSERDLKTKNATQHCYGDGHTDDDTWKGGLAKDRAVAQVLDSLSKHVSFKIITPTLFSKHYFSGALNVNLDS